MENVRSKKMEQVTKTIHDLKIKCNVYTRCPKKKWDLLLLLQVVNPTFFGTPCGW